MLVDEDDSDVDELQPLSSETKDTDKSAKVPRPAYRIDSFNPLKAFFAQQ